MFDVTESKSQGPKEREEEDRKLCEEVFQNILQVKDAKGEKIIRLGKPDSRIKRAVVVEVNEVGVKWGLIKRSRDLKDKKTQNIMRS